MVVPPVQFGSSPTGQITIKISAYVHEIVFTVNATRVKKRDRGSLVDRGANGGIAGYDTRIIAEHNKVVRISGIDNHEVSGLRMVDAAGITITDKGLVVLIMRQYARHDKQ